MTNRLTTLIFLAMLTIAPNSLRAQSAIFTTEQQNKLAKLMSEHGDKVTLDSGVTTALGITKQGKSLVINQLAVDESKTIKHCYMTLPNGGFLIAVDDSSASARAAYVYRLDANFQLIAAVKKVSGKQPVAIPTTDAKRAVDVEINIWVTEVLNKH
jgi:sugar lactone lactonase YvrE